jgi:hypothetical protein
MSLTAQLVIGVYGVHLDEIAKIQSVLPEQVLYLQPYSPNKMSSFKRKKADWPSYFLFSTTDEVNKISYVAKVHNWEDKIDLYENNKKRWDLISTVIINFMLNEYEEGLYRHSSNPEKLCRNLLSVTQMRKLPTPIHISELIKTTDKNPHGERSQPGGWSEIALTYEQITMINDLINDD